MDKGTRQYRYDNVWNSAVARTPLYRVLLKQIRETDPIPNGLRQDLTEGYKKMWKWERTITALSSIKNMVAIYFPHHAKDQGKFHTNSFTDQCSEYILCKTVMQRYFWKKTTSEHFKLLSVQKHWAINEKC